MTPPDIEMARLRSKVKQSLEESDEEGARGFVREWARRRPQWAHAAEFAEAVDAGIVAARQLEPRLRPSRVAFAMRASASRFAGRPYDPGPQLQRLRDRFRANGGCFPPHLPTEFLMSVVEGYPSS